jgi:hypothetical protein
MRARLAAAPFFAALKRQSISNACPQISIETLIDLAAIDHF